MKFFLTLGAAGGFGLAFVSSLHAGNEVAFALRDGAIGLAIGAVLLRFLHSVLFSSLVAHVSAQKAEAEARRLQSDEPPAAS